MSRVSVRLISVVLAMAAAALVGGCGRRTPGASGADPGGAKPKDAGEVVLYYSADDVIARPIIEAFERRSGVHVLGVGDTEATKNTGLVERLRMEKSRPRADVFWSGEVFLTIRLAGEGVLAPHVSESLAAWPGDLRDAQRRWHAFAERARVVVYNTRRVSAQDAPTEMVDLLRPRWKGRVGMCRPSTGTARGHMAALVALWGEGPTRSWLAGMKDNGVRLYDGNAPVVQAVANGEIDVGLTDSDDVWAGKRNEWPVESVYVRHDLPGALAAGPLLIPSAVSRVRGGPNPENAAKLIDFLLSADVERMIAESDSHNFPVRPEVAQSVGLTRPADPAPVSLWRIADSMDAAMKLCDETLGG